MSDLASATTDELWEELCARHDSLLMIGTLRMGEHETGESAYWRGPYPMLLGLVDLARERLLEEYFETAREEGKGA